MAPIPEKALAALNAMKAIGISIQTSKPVLKSLLKVYDNSWEYIEAENYRVLADAILDIQETQTNEDKPKKKIPDDGILRKGKEVIIDEPEPLRTRARARKEDNHVPSSKVSFAISAEPSQKKNVPDDQDIPGKGKEAVSDEPEPLRTRVRSRKEDHHLPSSKGSFDLTGEPSIKRPKLEQDVLPDVHYEQERAGLVYSKNCRGKTVEPALPQSSLAEATLPNLPSPPSLDQNKIDIVLPQMRNSAQRHGQALVRMNDGETTMNQTDEACQSQKDKQSVQEKVDNSILLKKPKDEPDSNYQKEHDTVDSSSGPIRPINEPCGCDSPMLEIPLSTIFPPRPPSPGEIGAAQDGQSKNDSRCLPVNERKKGTTSEILYAQESSSFNVDIASSDLGEVKLSFCCSPDRPDFHAPNLEAVLKLVEDRCLNSYKILQPSFSLTDLMKEMCQCFLELGSETTDDNQDNVIFPTLDSLKKPIRPGVYDVMPSCLNNSLGATAPDSCVHNAGVNDQNGISREIKEAELPKSSESLSLVVLQQPKCPRGDLRPLHDANDISKGEEKVKIPVVNEITSDKYPPSFNYIPRNIVYQNAFVNFSLARIGDEDCCADCFNNCLAAPLPCSCARETGGEYAYTLDGLVRKEFLDECISMYREPQMHHKFFCGDCPLERSKNEGSPEACKGHLLRKFIKECWSKCGCSMHCGNRVVQRGITRNFQVFLTSKEKGWGLQTLEELPRGAFVCEYVGEVLTNTELYERTIQTTGNAKHTYPVLLDADWGSEGSLKDEEALCLDATFYGNVARFINHRCSDANMIEIPVEVETPDHHYYHLAFFTTRKVEASEELTWDYGIDFDDHDHPIKAFRCRCGSRLCRDTRRRKRSRASR